MCVRCACRLTQKKCEESVCVCVYKVCVAGPLKTPHRYAFLLLPFSAEGSTVVRDAEEAVQHACVRECACRCRCVRASVCECRCACVCSNPPGAQRDSNSFRSCVCACVCRYVCVCALPLQSSSTCPHMCGKAARFVVVATGRHHKPLP